MNDFEYTLTDGRLATIEPGKVYGADPSVGIFGDYCEEFGVYDADGKEITVSGLDEAGIWQEIGKRLIEREYDEY